MNRMSQSYRKLLRFTSKPGPNLFPTGGETPHPVGTRMAELYKDFENRVKDCNQDDLTDAVAKTQSAHTAFIASRKNLTRATHTGDRATIKHAEALVLDADYRDRQACKHLLVTLRMMKHDKAINALQVITAITFVTWYYHIGNPLSNIISNSADKPSF